MTAELGSITPTAQSPVSWCVVGADKFLGEGVGVFYKCAVSNLQNLRIVPMLFRTVPSSFKPAPTYAHPHFHLPCLPIPTL